MALLIQLRPSHRADGLVWCSEGPGRWVARDRSRRFVAIVEAVDGCFVPMLADGRELPPQATVEAARGSIAALLTPGRSTDLVMHLAGAAGALAAAIGIIQAAVTGG